ncbi:MAG TPA: ABC transporter ATP-binding protein [Acidobacteriaceae bacterium]|jgi:ABC-type multidrug transport system ATPase subunit|nr:ABC transporter ATP-binding protein [Acidobacteriaceae bacterium]
MNQAEPANGAVRVDEPTCASGAARVAAARLDAVSKLYGSFAALRKVTVEFAAGSSTVVLGDNGAGKSTLLRMIAGLISPTRGTVHVFGKEPRWQRRRVAYMSHEAMLYDEMSAMENLRYFARLQRDGSVCSCSGGPERALQAVGLDPKLTRPVGQYSQGMKQRASLARVLQTDPELLLLDEPFSNLDVNSAKHMVELLMEFRSWPVEGVASEQTGRGRTIILTTHQAHLAEPLAETTLTMRAGAIMSSVNAAGEAQ